MKFLNLLMSAKNWSRRYKIWQKYIQIPDKHPVSRGVSFEFFVFDRDSISERNSISIKHGRNITNRNEALDFFKKFSWISIYREWFRIRPYWDPWEDWLWLNARRVNNPTLRLSSNQIIWYVTIKSESESHLIEASSRERLKENSYYNWLIYELRKTLSILEEKRSSYRQQRKPNIKWEKNMNVSEEINRIKDGVQWIKSEWDKEKAIKDIEDLWHRFEKEKERLIAKKEALQKKKSETEAVIKSTRDARHKKFLKSLKGVEKAAAEVIISNLNDNSEIVEIYLVENK